MHSFQNYRIHRSIMVKMQRNYSVINEQGNTKKMYWVHNIIASIISQPFLAQKRYTKPSTYQHYVLQLYLIISTKIHLCWLFCPISDMWFFIKTRKWHIRTLINFMWLIVVQSVFRFDVKSTIERDVRTHTQTHSCSLVHLLTLRILANLFISLPLFSLPLCSVFSWAFQFS